MFEPSCIRSRLKGLVRALSVNAVMAALLSPYALRAQTTLYWDTNGATSGASSGTTATGTWAQTTGADWSTSSAGTATTTTWSAAIGSGSGIADFSAGTNATGAFTVTVSGTVTGVAGITFGEGSVTLGGTGTLTLTNSGTINVAATTGTISAILAGSANLTKTGSGTLVISSSETYTGATNINAGTLQLGAKNLIPNASAVVIASGATFAVNGYSDTVGSIAGAGTISLSTGHLQFGYDNTSTTFSGVISGTSGSLISKSGTGTTVLSGANTFVGATTVSAGILNIQNNTALGTATNSATVISGATLQVQGGLTGVGEALTLNGTGTAGNGALENVSDNNTLTGAFVLGSASQINSDAGVLTLSGGITGAYGLTVGGSGSTDITGVIGTTTGTLTKVDAGTLTLAGANTYTGATTISGGIVSISADNNLGTAPSSVTTNDLTLDGGTLQTAANMTLSANRGTTLGAGGGTLDQTAGTTLTYAGIIAGSGALTKIDSGTLILSGVDTYTGATAINAGTLSAGANNVLANTTAVTVASGATYNLNNYSDSVGSIAGAGNITLGSGALTAGADNTSTTFSGVISGTGSLTKSGSGTLVLSGADTYSGATTVSAGVLNIQNNTALGTTTGGVTVASGAALQIQNGITVTGKTLTLSGTGVSNDGALRNVTGNSTWTGAVVLGAASRINSDAGTLTLSGNISGNGQKLSVGGAGNTVISGAIATTTGSLTKDGTGTVVLAGSNTYTGGTNINAGTLTLGANNAVPNGPVAVASGATFNLNSYSETVGALSGAGTLQLASGTLIVGSGNASSTFSGSFAASDTGTFEKTGTGTLTLGTGMNFSSGNLVLNGGTLNLGGFTSTFSTLTVTANSILDFTGTSILNLNSVVVDTGVTLTIEDWSNTIDYFYSLTNPGSANLGRIVFSGYSATNTQWQSFDHEITPVPEPSAYGAAFTLAGLAACILFRRRQKPAAGNS